MSAAWLSLLMVSVHPAAAADVELNFRISVPADTPAGATLFIAGNLPALGGWSADGLPLARTNDGTYAAAVRVPAGATLEFKITRGSWETVEKGPRGEEIANRRHVAREDQTVTLSVASWSTTATRRSTITGRLVRHERFASKILKHERTLLVLLPPDDARRPDRRYPVLYMHDGQNLFDDATSFAGEWHADETAHRLIAAGRIEPIIIVGIPNALAERADEYTPWPDAGRRAGGRGRDYARFLVEEVKPFIDRTYRTQPGREHTAVAGSSLGGLISLWIGLEHPDTFSKVGVISPALLWADRRIIDECRRRPEALRRLRIWLDMGTAEGGAVPEFNTAIADTRALAAVFDEAGLRRSRDYAYWEVEAGQHNEAAWAGRFDQVLQFLFGA